MNYNYSSSNENLSFDSGLKKLKEKNGNRVKVGWPPLSTNNKELIDKMLNLGINVESIYVSKTEYENYLQKVNYEMAFPEYYPDNLTEKSFEHYIGYSFFRLKSGQTFLDIASEHSPVGEIFNKLTHCNSFQQDIMFKSGVYKNRIGSPASKIPLESASVNSILLSCSIEHFENSEDIDCMKECIILLVKNGIVVIVPLYINDIAFVATDPLYSAMSDVLFDNSIPIHCIKGWNNRHGRFYNPKSLFERIIKNNKALIDFSVYEIENLDKISPSLYCRFVLVGEKKCCLVN